MMFRSHSLSTILLLSFIGACSDEGAETQSDNSKSPGTDEETAIEEQGSSIVANGEDPNGSESESETIQEDTEGENEESGPVCDPSGDNHVPFNNDEPSLYQATNFENGTVDPFVICTTKSPNYGRGANFMGRDVLEFHWKEESYNGTRSTKGAEACGGPRFHKEGWYGFQFYLPSPGFPMDKNQGIAQIFGLGGCSSWVSKLDVTNNSLIFSRRGHCGTAVDVVIEEDIERNKWHSVVIHFVASHVEQGLTEVWFDEDACNQNEPTYRAENINYGFGDADPFGWDTTTDSLVRRDIDPNSQGGFREYDPNEIEFKIGMYTFDNENYTPGETRTLYYDNVSMLADEGASGFKKVNPAF